MARILGCGRSRSSRWAGRREPASAARRHETFLAGRRDVGSPSVPAAPDRRHVHLRVVELRHPIPLAVATAQQARHRPVVSSLPPVPSEAARYKSRITRQGWLTWSAAGRAPGGPDRRDHFEVQRAPSSTTCRSRCAVRSGCNRSPRWPRCWSRRWWPPPRQSRNPERHRGVRRCLSGVLGNTPRGRIG
jgi:hypothetical protein